MGSSTVSRTVPLIVGTMALIITLYLLRPWGGETLNLVVGICTGLISLGLALSSVFRLGWKSGVGLICALIAAFFTVTIVADVIWFALAETQLVSPADILWYIGYAALFAAEVIGFRLLRTSDLMRRRIIAAFILMALLAGTVYYRINPFLFSPELDIIGNLVTWGYVIAGLLLLIAGIPLAFAVSRIRGYALLPWLLFLAGVAVYLVAETHYAVNYASYEAGSFIDMLWYFGYLLLGCSAFEFRRTSERALSETLKERSGDT